MKKILIIGKRGFLGKNLYKNLKKKFKCKLISFNQLYIFKKNINKFDFIINCSINKQYINIDDSSIPNYKKFEQKIKKKIQQLRLLLRNSIITNNSTIYPPYNIEIVLKDYNPINLSGLNYHNFRIWYDDNTSNSIILGFS